MKIKTKQKLNLPELIKYVWGNDIESTGFLSNEELPDGKNVRVHVNPRDVARGRCAGVSVESGDFVVDDMYTFTVEVEEELKMVTKIPLIVHMYIDSDGVERSENCYNQSIIECQFPTQSEEISLTMYSASGGDLTFIWNGRHGIPEDGILKEETE